MKRPKNSKNHYVDTKELEKHWGNWLATDCPKSWEYLTNEVYKICQGVAVHFNPKDEDEHLELSHETFALTIDKIKSRKLIFQPGRAPVFNLLTTTIFRHLYSLKNRDNRRRRLLYSKYLTRPGVLEQLLGVSDVCGNTETHPDLSQLISALMPQLCEVGKKD